MDFDNLLYISIEAKRVAAERQKYVRQVGIVLAIGLRIALLFVVLQLIDAFQSTFFSVQSLPVSASVNGHSLIVLFGGVFLIYTALKEIFHMLVIEDLGHGGVGGVATRTVGSALVWIVIMNIVFSLRYGPVGDRAHPCLRDHGRGNRRFGPPDGVARRACRVLLAEKPNV